MFSQPVPHRPVGAAAVLLMAGPADLDARRLADLLSAVLAPAGLTFRRADCTRGITLCAGSLHLTLTGQGTPYKGAALDRALRSRLGHHVGEDWPALVEAHDGAITVATTEGPAEGDDGRASEASDEAPNDVLGVLTQIVTHVAATYLVLENAKSVAAILWEPSSQLFAPARFVAMAEMLDPLPLFLHPFPMMTQDPDGGADWLGLEFLGAYHLLGHPLRMRPAQASLSWLAQRVWAFVAHMRNTHPARSDDVMQDIWLHAGDSFEVERGERIVLSWDDDGGLALRLTHLGGRPAPQAPFRSGASATSL